MKTLVPVVFATDDIFAPYCGASIASLIANADSERKYALYVFYDELSQENIDKLNSMGTDNISVECICITPYVDKDLLYTHKRLTVATYFRFFTADVLPQYDKLLYLDSDIAILSDIGGLYDIDIGDNLLGGIVIYRGRENERKLKEEYLNDLMGVTPDRYVNAGILSMNLKGFREQGIKDKCLAYVGEHRELRWLDQDVLNAVCKGQIEFLPTEWNTSQFYYEEDYLEGIDVSGTHLIHYIDRIKPWLVDFRPSHLHFYKYSQLCPYADELNAMYLENNKERATRKKPVEGAAKPAAKPVAKSAAKPAEKPAEKPAAKLTVGQTRQQMLNLAVKGQIGPRFLIKCYAKWLKGRFSGKAKK